MDKYSRARNFLLLDASDKISVILSKKGQTAIREVHLEKNYIEFCIGIAGAADPKTFSKYGPAIAKATNSPGGKVAVLIPYPKNLVPKMVKPEYDKTLIGIRIPHPSEKILKETVKSHKELLVKYPGTIQQKIADFFYLRWSLLKRVFREFLPKLV